MDIFLTAEEAFPAFERACLKARREIVAGFRVFDLKTQLCSEAGLEIGTDWFDLLVHTLQRGVRVKMILTDFDPVARPASHRMSWRSARHFYAAAEASGRPDLLDLTIAMHPARIGPLSRLMLWPKTYAAIRKEARRLNSLPAREAASDLQLMPELRKYLAGEHPQLRPALRSLPSLVPTTHHHKVAVFDSDVAYVGGLDLDDRRYDTLDHDRPAAETWHDCQMMISGPAAADLRRHILSVQDVSAGRGTCPKTPHILRTLSRPRTASPFALSAEPVVTEIEDAHISAIKAAEQLIYLESQFFRSRELCAALVDAGAQKPDLKLVVVLPAAPEDVAFASKISLDARFGEYLQARSVKQVQNAFGARAVFVSPAQRRAYSSDDRDTLAGAPIIYVHAKVSIFDDTQAIISSANLNGRSLRQDTEVGVSITDPSVIRDFRGRAVDHWLGSGQVDARNDLDGIAATFAMNARRNLNLAPENRQGFVLPFPQRDTKKSGRYVPALPEELA